MHMKCPYCATENRPEHHFCEECGAQLVAAEAADLVTSTANLATGLVPGTSLQQGRYVIATALGEGGMGSVLLAKDTRLADKLTVIKVLNAESSDPEKLQEDVRNFKREAETLAHLDHPLIPDVTDHFEEGLHYYMVMDYVDGENLEDWLDRRAQAMDEHDALRYALEVLDILEYLARQQPAIVHRDIKPANIIIGTKDRHAHLVDFGIARPNTVSDGKLRKTAALGTPGYAPPEQYQGFADPRSDLYALAATLHHLVTNRDPGEYAPFQFPAARTLNPAISQRLEQVLTRGLKTDASERYQTARQMRADLEALVAGTPIAGTTDGYRLSDSIVRQTLSAPSARQAVSADTPTRGAFEQAPRSTGRPRQPQESDYSDPDYYQHLQSPSAQQPRPMFQPPSPLRPVQQRQQTYPPQRAHTSRDQENQVMWYFILFVVAICIIALVAVLLFSSLHIY